MEASFHSLFRRRERDQVSPKEVFAVAAIAFCLKHDDEFKRAFICDFCGIKLPAHIPKLRIAADDHKWGDLAVHSDDPSFACVLEFKIDSPVDPKQNPNLPEFEYALQISKSPECRDCDEKRFIVVTKDEAVQKIKPNCSEQHEVCCDWKSWTELSGVKPTSSLALDLFVCLGDFGIQPFRERQLRTMNLTNFAMGSNKVPQALASIYKQLFHKRLRVEEMSDEGSADDCWNTGINIAEKLSAEFEGWFGFEGNKQANQPIPESNCAVVYFYCHASQEKEDRLQRILGEKGFKAEKVPAWDKATICNVVVRNFQGKDLDWFESVYKSVGAIK